MNWLSLNIGMEGNGPTREGVLPYISILECAAPKGMVFAPFCLKTGKDFAHFGLKLGMVSEGTTGVYECIPNEKERKRNMQI